MAESWRTWLEGWGFTLFPALRRTGARLTYIADDHREVRIVLPFSWRTRNYGGARRRLEMRREFAPQALST